MVTLAGQFCLTYWCVSAKWGGKELGLVWSFFWLGLQCQVNITLCVFTNSQYRYEQLYYFRVISMWDIGTPHVCIWEYLYLGTFLQTSEVMLALKMSYTWWAKPWHHAELSSVKLLVEKGNQPIFHLFTVTHLIGVVTQNVMLFAHMCLLLEAWGYEHLLFCWRPMHIPS